MQALVLGATGHIGAHVVRALVAGGHEVRAAYRTERFLHVLDGLPVERVRVDLDTREGLDAALAGCPWVFHAASYYPGFRDRRDAAMARAVESTQRVLERLAAAQPQRVVFTSSAATIQRVPGRRATEEDAEPWPSDGWRSLYATVKIAVEHEVWHAHQAGLPVVVVNPSICLGEYDAHAFSGRLLLVFAKRKVPFYLEHQVNVIYTGDVGIGHVRAAERGRVGERYLLAAHNIALQDFARRVAEAAGVAPPRWRMPYRAALALAVASEGFAWLTRSEPILPRQGIHSARRPQRLDASKAIRELELPQTPLSELISRTLAWFRRHGYN